MTSAETRLYRSIYLLSIFTIVYNIVEGLVSMYFGFENETLTLFGFGADSFIEVVSGIGILQMVIRIRHNPQSAVSTFEVRALQITGAGFYFQSAGLLAGIILALAEKHKPSSTLAGAIISCISILVMIWLANRKFRIGKKLNSAPITADAQCTMVCIYMSVVLLATSAIYELTSFAYADVIGSAGLIWFSVREGREAFKKAKERSYEECNCH